MPEETEEPTKTLQDKIEKTILDARRIFFAEAVDNQTAREAIQKLWYLELNDPGKPILFVINSPGGAIDSGFAVWDQIMMITSPVTTLVTGLAASMGSILSLCAKPGRRFATPNARIMIHQPSLSGVMKGQATDLSIQAKEIIKTKEILIEIYCNATKQPRDVIEKALDRDKWMGAAEALEFGLLDKIVTSYAELY